MLRGADLRLALAGLWYHGRPPDEPRGLPAPAAGPRAGSLLSSGSGSSRRARHRDLDRLLRLPRRPTTPPRCGGRSATTRTCRASCAASSPGRLTLLVIAVLSLRERDRAALRAGRHRPTSARSSPPRRAPTPAWLSFPIAPILPTDTRDAVLMTALRGSLLRRPRRSHRPAGPGTGASLGLSRAGRARAPLAGRRLGVPGPAPALPRGRHVADPYRRHRAARPRRPARRAHDRRAGDPGLGRRRGPQPRPRAGRRLGSALRAPQDGLRRLARRRMAAAKANFVLGRWSEAWIMANDCAVLRRSGRDRRLRRRAARRRRTANGVSISSAIGPSSARARSTCIMLRLLRLARGARRAPLRPRPDADAGPRRREPRRRPGGGSPRSSSSSATTSAISTPCAPSRRGSQPTFEPRYLACTAGFALPHILLDVTALIEDGPVGHDAGRGRRRAGSVLARPPPM